MDPIIIIGIIISFFLFISIEIYIFKERLADDFNEFINLNLFNIFASVGLSIVFSMLIESINDLTGIGYGKILTYMTLIPLGFIVIKLLLWGLYKKVNGWYD